ncbi:hypothetical protein MZTS_03945 [Methylorubrum zatmanii]|nr:hypothetical protein [Methylorubrum zatmanii]
MSLPDLATNASRSGSRPILFGLLADGSGAARFSAGPAPLMPSPGEPACSRFSPSADWYGRWAVRPLRGVLAAGPDAAAPIRPEDIVVLAPRRA